MQWIILLVITVLVLLFMVTRRTDERGDNEYTLPRRGKRRTVDMEIAEESGRKDLVGNDQRIQEHNGGSDEEFGQEIADDDFSEEYERKISMDFDGELGSVYNGRDQQEKDRYEGRYGQGRGTNRHSEWADSYDRPDNDEMSRDQRHSDREYTVEFGGFSRSMSKDYVERIGNEFLEEAGEDLAHTDLHELAERLERSFVKTPIHHGKARSHSVEFAPEWEVVGVIDAVPDPLNRIDSEKENVAMLGELDAVRGRGGDAEFALELGSAVSLDRASGVTIYDSSISADHVIQIGVPAQLEPAHDMPIHMQLQPTLVALPKDPYWAFVYWVLPAEVPEGHWELKIRNISEQQEYFQRVDRGARRWYLHLNQPTSRFAFELGVRDASGRFITVLSSNEISLPPDRPSDLIDAEWLTVDEFYVKTRKGKMSHLSSAAFAEQRGGASEQLFAPASR